MVWIRLMLQQRLPWLFGSCVKDEKYRDRIFSAGAKD